jgi:hypothetical protein
MEVFTHLNYVAIIVSAAIYFFIGFFWYRLNIFGKIFLLEKGVNLKKKPEPMTLQATIIQFGGVFLTLLLYTIGIAVFIQLTGWSGLTGGILTAVMTILFFVIPMNANNLFFPPKPKLFLIDCGYHSLNTLIISIILSVWK